MATTDFSDGITLSAAAWFDDADAIVYGYLTGTAGTNTITATGPAPISAYAAGQRFWFLPANTNTGATTINITPSGGAALGAKSIFCGGAACVGGEIRASVPCHVVYDGTQFSIAGPYVGGSLPTGQIKFPAAQNASSDANTLDDYEEGTWTPAVAFGGAAVGITYSVQAGNYTKVGNLVTAWFSISLSSKGSSVGNATLTGLPFTIANTSGVSGAEAVNFTNMTATLVASTLQGNINTTTANIYGIGAAGTTNQTLLTDASFANNTIMVAKMTFRV